MSISLAFYLKYRPQSLDELVGQDNIKKTLLLSFQNKKLSHAYLFVGPRGTGKTSTARILAKMVNCEGEGESVKGKVPCNECAACTSITDGSNLDLIEIDAASNRGIEDIRSLRDKIKLVPTNARKKVYIIDEVHMLTTEAFNALLKTLEEPPDHALFILATTDLGKIPQTILSRVQRLDFKLATPKELLEALRKIVKSEKIDIGEEALSILAKKSDGSFRDGVKLLDQIASAGGKITAKVIGESLRPSQFEDDLDLLQSLSSKNTSAGLLIISKQLENGADAKEMILSLMETLRSLVFIKNGLGEQLVEIHLTEDKYQNLVQSAQGFSDQDLVRTLDILQGSLEKLKFTSIPSLPLELAIVEICGLAVTHETEPNGVSTPSGVFESAVIAEEQKVVESVMPSNENLSPDIQKLKEKWTFVLETVRQINFSLEALLRSINISQCTENSVIMEVPYSFHQRILEAPKNRDLLEGLFSDILGRNIRISAVLGSRPVRRDDVVNIEVAEDDEIIRAAAEIFNSDTVN